MIIQFCMYDGDSNFLKLDLVVASTLCGLSSRRVLTSVVRVLPKVFVMLLLV